MTDTLEVPEEIRAFFLDPKVLAAGVILLCAGIWVGFKLAGGTVVETVHAPCADCAEKRAEAGVPDADQYDTLGD